MAAPHTQQMCMRLQLVGTYGAGVMCAIAFGATIKPLIQNQLDPVDVGKYALVACAQDESATNVCTARLLGKTSTNP